MAGMGNIISSFVTTPIGAIVAILVAVAGVWYIRSILKS